MFGGEVWGAHFVGNQCYLGTPCIRLPFLVVWPNFPVDHATFEALIGEQPLVFGVFLTMFLDLKPHQDLENIHMFNFISKLEKDFWHLLWEQGYKNRHTLIDCGHENIIFVFRAFHKLRNYIVLPRSIRKRRSVLKIGGRC